MRNTAVDMKQRIYIIISILAIVMIFISGCTSATKVYNYRTSGDDIIDEFYLVKTEYYPNKVVIYWDGTIDNLDKYDFSDAFEIKGNTLVLATDSPEEFTSFYMSFNDFDYKFRYLDSEQYACVLTVMDSEGGLHTSGSIDRYYTEEEKNKQKEQEQNRKKEQEEMYAKLQGTWTSEDGDCFCISKDDEYIVQYSIGEAQGTGKPVYFQNYLYAEENNIGIEYNDGVFNKMFPIVLSEDAQSFEYDGKVFYKELQ